MPFTDPRLPGKEYKTERGLKSALTALAKREAKELADKTVAQQAAKTAAYEALTAEPEPAPYNGPWFIRNLRHVPVRVRFGGKDGRSIKLEPRGGRGDLMQLQPGEEYDPALNDIGILFEALTAQQAAEVIGKQTTNQQAVHPALAHLRLPTGEQYEGTVEVQPEYNREQSILVGTVVDQGANEKNQQRTVVQRLENVGPERAALAGTQDRPIAHVSDAIEPEEQAAWVAEQGGIQALMARDAIARQQGAEGPAAGLGGLNVVIDTPQRDVAVTTRFDDAGIDPTNRTPIDPVTGQA